MTTDDYEARMAEWVERESQRMQLETMIAGVHGDRDHPYHNRDHPQHESAVALMSGLYELHGDFEREPPDDPAVEEARLRVAAIKNEPEHAYYGSIHEPDQQAAVAEVSQLYKAIHGDEPVEPDTVGAE